MTSTHKTYLLVLLGFSAASIFSLGWAYYTASIFMTATSEQEVREQLIVDIAHLSQLEGGDATTVKNDHVNSIACNRERLRNLLEGEARDQNNVRDHLKKADEIGGSCRL